MYKFYFMSSRLFSWGSGYKDNRRGTIPPVLGLGDYEGHVLPTKLKSLDEQASRIVNVVCGWDHCLALDDKGRMLSWGKYTYVSMYA
jgi:alpha-tubulin suppressor-like RCC1 family protein